MRQNLVSLLDDLEIPPITEEQAALCVLLRPRIEQLAADVWALAQKSPGLPADPALVALAAGQLHDLRRALRDEPGVHLLPPPFAPGVALHALALGLRAMERALALYLARRRPFAENEAPSDFEALSAMMYALMRGTVEQIAENHGVTLPPELLRARPDGEDEDENEDDRTPPLPPGQTSRSAARRHARLA